MTTGVTYQGSVAKLATNDVSDQTTAFKLTPTTNTPSVMTFGGSVSAAGETSWTGEITVIYDNSSGKAYSLLLAEAQTPTAGGYAIEFEAEGTATGNENIAVNAIVGHAAIEASGDGGVQTRTFPFTVNGDPVFTTQS